MNETFKHLPLDELRRLYSDLLDTNKTHLRRSRMISDTAVVLKEAIRMKEVEEKPETIVISDHAIVRYLERIEGQDIEAIRQMMRGMLAGRVDPQDDQDVIVDEESRIAFIVRRGTNVTTVLHADDYALPKKGQLKVTSETA